MPARLLGAQWASPGVAPQDHSTLPGQVPRSPALAVDSLRPGAPAVLEGHRGSRASLGSQLARSASWAWVHRAQPHSGTLLSGRRPPQVRGAVGGAQGPWQLLTPPRGVTYRPGPPRAVWRPGFLHGHHKATLPTPHKERGATPTGVFAAWGLGSAKWPCGLVAASFRKQLSRCCPPFRSVVLLPGAPVLPAPTRSGLESGGRGEGSVPSAACADGPSVSLRSLCRVRAVPAGPTGLSRGLWAASPGGPAAPAGPAGLPGGLGSAHCPCAGAERGRGRAHVSHHHPDPGGPGEVQGPSHHRPNRQRLRQHRHQVSRGLG